MKRFALLSMVLLAGTPALATAQGSGSPVPAPTGGIDRAERAFNVTRNIEGRVLQVLGDRLVIEDERGVRHTFAMLRDTRFRAHNESLLGDVSNPRLSDYRTGVEVKVTYNAENNEASVVEARRAETRSAKGTVISVDTVRNTLVIETEDGQRAPFSTLTSTEFKRDGNSPIGDKDEDDLTIADYATGFRVEFKYRVADNGLTELKARRAE